MIAALVLGALVGFGLIVSWRLLFPAPPPLQAAIDRLNRRNELVGITNRGKRDEQASDLFGRTVGASLTKSMRKLGLNLESLEADLRLVDRTIEEHMAQKALLALFGFGLPAMLGVFWSVLGIGIAPQIPVVGAVLLAIFFFFAPDLSLRSEAGERRKEFKRSLGSFLDLVVISLAGGAGVESALREAASVGRGWAYAQLHNALDVTALTGETPWAALARLGQEVGVPELVQLSSSVSLAGTEGARVRESLAVKASSLRDHALADAEADAESTTEKMALPVVLLFFGFLLLVGYPAITLILTGL